MKRFFLVVIASTVAVSATVSCDKLRLPASPPPVPKTEPTPPVPPVPQATALKAGTSDICCPLKPCVTFYERVRAGVPPAPGANTAQSDVRAPQA